MIFLALRAAPGVWCFLRAGVLSQPPTPRETIRLAMEAQDIESRPVWKPMHRQPLCEGTESIGGSVADRLFEQGLCLPSGSNLIDAEFNRVIDSFRSHWNNPEVKR